MSTFNIRKATPEDTQTIFNLIYKLAVYEKLENDVITTVEELRTNIFEKNYAEVLIAEEDQKPVGFALYFHNFSYNHLLFALYLKHQHHERRIKT